MNEHQEVLCKMLGLPTKGSWAEIYEAIGKLKERVEKPKEIVYFPNTNPMPLTEYNLNLHYHNGMPCRNNSCVWS